MWRHALAFGISVYFLSASSAAIAYDWFIDAKVAAIEATYMPAWIAFQIDTAGGTCAAGAFLNYTAQGSTATDKAANSAAVLATLLTAQSANKSVRVFGSNSGCAVSNIWVLP